MIKQDIMRIEIEIEPDDRKYELTVEIELDGEFESLTIVNSKMEVGGEYMQIPQTEALEHDKYLWDRFSEEIEKKVWGTIRGYK